MFTLDISMSKSPNKVQRFKLRQRGQSAGRLAGPGPKKQQKQQPQKPKTRENLDMDLDQYMAKSKGHLDADLDTYMAQANTSI